MTAVTFVNPIVTFLENTEGVVVDGRSTQHGSEQGHMVVKDVADAGLFAFYETGTLANLALLTGATQSYGLTAVVVTDQDTVDDASGGVSASSCAADAGSAAVYALSGCTVELSTALDQPSDGSSVTATYGAFEAVVPFAVWTPTEVSVSVADDELNRIEYADGTPVECAAEQYQRTTMTATVDAVSYTHLTLPTILLV